MHNPGSLQPNLLWKPRLEPLINVHFKVGIYMYITQKKTLPIYIVINSNSVELNAI